MKTEFQVEKEKGTEGVTQTAELTIQFMQLDLTSLNSTKTFIQQFKASGRKLNVLVCNAGIAYAPMGNKMKKKIYHIVETIAKSNIIITERCIFDRPNTEIPDRSLSGIGTGTSIKSGGAKLILRAQIKSPLEVKLW